MKNLLILIYFSLFASSLFAQDFPEKPNPPRLVNDFGDMLTPEEEANLEYKLVAYNDTTSTQISIITRKSLGDYEAGDYAVQLAEKWGIGQKGKNNGILVLVSLDDRKSFIATGYGMEGVLPDAMIGRIRDQYLKANLKNGLYYQAFDQTTTALIKLAAGEFKGEGGKQKERKGSPAGFLIVLAVIFFVFILPLFSRARRAQRNHMGGGGGGLGWLTALFLMNSVGRGGSNGSSWGNFSGGSGDFGGGGNDFGGFGGGDFGGGGAGGDW